MKTYKVQKHETKVNISYQDYDAIDLSEAENLKLLYCSYNNITELNVSGCVNLKELFCRDNKLIKLNVSGCVNLEWLDCRNNKLTKIYLSNPKFRYKSIRYIEHDHSTVIMNN